MKLIIIRHGETEENAAKIMMGQAHGKLSQKGISQAKLAAKWLQNERIDYIYCSDLKRTKDTVKEILKNHDCLVEYDPLLRERNLGIYQGQPTSRFRDDERASGLDHNFIPPKGESVQEIGTRADQFIKKILSNHSDNETILICTHFGWKCAFISCFLGISLTNKVLDEYGGSNAAISIFEFKNGKPAQIHMINSTEHLGES